MVKRFILCIVATAPLLILHACGAIKQPYSVDMIGRGFDPEDVRIVHGPLAQPAKIDAALGVLVSVEGDVPQEHMGAVKEKLMSALVTSIGDLQMFRSVSPGSEKVDLTLNAKFSYSHVGTPHLEAIPIACITLMAYTPTTVTTNGKANVVVSCAAVSDTLAKEFESEGEGFVASEIYSGAGVGAARGVGAASSALMDRILAFLVENRDRIEKIVGAKKPLDDFFKAVQENNLKEVKNLIGKGANVNAVDSRTGGTALHVAAGRGFQSMAGLLIDKKADISIADFDGKTPLHRAAEEGHADVARLLLEKGASAQVKDNRGKTPADLAWENGRDEIWEMIRCGAVSAAFARCEAKKELGCYREFIARYGEGECADSPKLDLARRRVQDLLGREQACRLKEENWIYRGDACRGGVAHGEGVAYHTEKDLRFEGTFDSGHRVKGIIYQGETPLFDGPIVDGRPDGVGICFHEGEPEECKFYKGKRVDAVYKQRIELAKQRKEIEQIKKDMTDEMNRKVEEMKQTQTAVPQAYQGTDSVVSDAVKKKATEMIMDEIFDRLF